MVTITLPPAPPEPDALPEPEPEAPQAPPEPPPPPKLPREMIPDDVRTYLYRFYDVGGQLLYVGITGDLPRRMREHGKKKEWWVWVARMEVRVYPSRLLAAVNEHEAIETEDPRYNSARYGFEAHLRSQGVIR